MDLRDVAIFMGRCEKALFQATFGHKTRTLMLIASVSKLAFLYAVVLGGTSTMGGIGSVFGTLIGVLIIGVLRKGFTLLNFSGNIFNFTLGLLLIVALIVFAILEKKEMEKKATLHQQ